MRCLLQLYNCCLDVAIYRGHLADDSKVKRFLRLLHLLGQKEQLSSWLRLVQRPLTSSSGKFVELLFM